MNKVQSFIFENLGALVKLCPNIRFRVEQPYFNEDTYFVEYTPKSKYFSKKDIYMLDYFQKIMFPIMIEMKASANFTTYGDLTEIDKKCIIFTINY